MRRLGLAFGGLAALVAFLFIVAAGCGDGGGGEVPSPAPPELKERLRRMVLRAEDLPAGFNLIDEVFSTNQDVADASPDPEGQLARLRQWGRILGYELTYEPSEPAAEGQSIIFSVNSTASIYESAEGASASFADAAKTARDTDWAAQFQGAADIVVEEVSAPAVADEVLWLRIRGKAEAGEQTFAHDVVILRTGALRGSLQAGSFGTQESKEFVERLMRAQAEHMATAPR